MFSKYHQICTILKTITGNFTAISVSNGRSFQPNFFSVLQFANEKGQFEVRMRIYEDSSYAPEHEYRQSPSIIIGSFVYVQV